MNEDCNDTNKSDPLTIWQRRLVVVVLCLLSIFLGFQLATYFADLLRILGISILIAYLLINIVDFLESRLRSRAIAVILVYIIVGVLLSIALIFLVPSVLYQVSQLLNTLFNRFPDIIQWLTHMLTPVETKLRAAQIEVRAADILSTIASNIPKPDPSAIVYKLIDISMSTMTWALYAISISVASFYFLLDGHRLKDAVIRMCPIHHRNALNQLATDMDKSLQAFFRGQIALGLLAGMVMLVVYLFFNIQYALLLSIFLAAWEIIPVIGPPIGFFPAIISVAIHGMNLPVNRLLQILIIIIVFNVLQQIKDNVIAPRYIGNVIGLHPILIFVAIMVGARLDGIVGIIFALPVACVTTVLLQHLPLKSEENLPPNANLLQTINKQS